MALLYTDLVRFKNLLFFLYVGLIRLEEKQSLVLKAKKLSAFLAYTYEFISFQLVNGLRLIELMVDPKGPMVFIGVNEGIKGSVLSLPF